uniref:Zinc transporter ZIP11 n=1 Tax=Cacopsylla melanoneura TaxID=428564 RepID=A0A8D9EPL4_9HEMI
MLPDHHPLVQTLLGTLFTWGLTAAGAAMVIIFNGTQRKLLDTSLGFAAGVMLAASYWSLLAPAIEMAEQSKIYGEDGQFAFIPVAVGFFFGALFVFLTDMIISSCGIQSPNIMLAMQAQPKRKSHSEPGANLRNSETMDEFIENGASVYSVPTTQGRDSSRHSSFPRRRAATHSSTPGASNSGGAGDYDTEDIGGGASGSQHSSNDDHQSRWRRILLLIIAITVHNIPEGLAVGVAFGAIGSSPSATFHNAKSLAIGIGIQNFPEGLAVSLPLRGAGFSVLKSFWYGQLSGMVEPLAGILGAALVSLMQPLLPYALSFAAGAMIYVVVDDIIPEANTCGNGKLASWGTIVGFMVMMALDVGLGA